MSVNGRTETIVRKLLGELAGFPHRQCSDNILKSSVDLKIHPNALASEWLEAAQFAESQGWILGVRPAMGPVKWFLTDPGLSEHLAAQRYE